MQPWRLLDTGQRSAAENMCLDEAILMARAEGVIPNTLRFLEFRPGCVLVGYHQDPDSEIRADFCRQAAIEVNRRITGGGALYFGDGVLGWEFIADKESGPRDVLALYRKLCTATIEGLRILGVDASFRPVNDIEVEGRKISGTGGTEVRGAFLFQGTLLVDLDSGAVRYAVYKNIWSAARLARQRAFRVEQTDNSLRATYFGGLEERMQEPFAFLHRMQT